MPLLPIVLSSSEYYLPFVDVLIQSIMENSNPGYYYDFIVLNSGFSKLCQENSLMAVKRWNNLSLRFVNIAPLMAIEARISEQPLSQTWFRITAPFLLNEYKKVLYLDCDTVVDDDVSKIFEIEIEDRLIAATRDLRVIAASYIFPRRKKYCQDCLTVESMQNYFQAGVMIINLDKFRQYFSLPELLNKALSQNWELCDQDMLNSIIPNKEVYYLDQRWDVVVDYKDRCQPWINKLPHALYDLYIEAYKNPAIVHYGGPYKPLSHEDIDKFFIFWKYARRSDFYEFILMRSMSEKSKNKERSSQKLYVSQRKGAFWNVINFLLPDGSKRRLFIKKIFGFTH